MQSHYCLQVAFHAAPVILAFSSRVKLNLKTSNSSFIFKHHYSMHSLMKEKVFLIMILIPIKDLQQLKWITINPKEKDIW